MEGTERFARKYRPTTIEGYIGNKEVKETVKRYLKKTMPQTILLMGPSGCGKTTLGRLLAKAYLCEDKTEENEACGECITCQAVDEYIRTGEKDSLPDLYEIVASDNSGKRDVDAMLEQMNYPPMAGDWKVFIIDEIHSLSQNAMERLLKTMEEPPEGVVMICCTTNPEKLLPTILNRCQLKLSITKPSTKEIIELLQKVCLTEGKEYDISGLRMIATRAENVQRDSLNYLEQVLNTRGNAKIDSVSEEFTEVADSIIFDFYKAYIEKDYLRYINVLYKIKTTYTFSQFLSALTNFTVRGIYVLNSIEVEGLSLDELKAYTTLFKKFSIKDLSTILSKLRKLNLGDIETNLIAFIYCDEDDEKEKIEVSVKKEDVQKERVFRNTNMEALETVKLREGAKSVSEQLESVDLKSMSELFQLEKVSD